LKGGTYPPRWDTWQRLFQPLLSTVPTMTIPGNHEIEWLPGHPGYDNSTALLTAYNARLPAPQLGPNVQPRTNPVLDRSTGYANGYYMVKVPGVATFITLTPYSPNDYDKSAPNKNGYSKSNEQYIWLEQQLKVCTPNGVDECGSLQPLTDTAW
jgi:Calcineurin-like phosphoesterase